MSSSFLLQPLEISLKDAVKFIVDNRGKTAPTELSGIALIATNCVNNKDLYPQKLNLRYVSQDTYDHWFRSHPLPGDILLTNKGSQNGAVCLVPYPVDFCIAQDMVALRADSEKISPLYLFAALRSDLVQKRMKALNVDAVIPHLKKTDFDKLFIPLPERKVQDWIGNTYFELCNRIELLRETNTTLESIARALFKSWFVDFDPVHANAGTQAPSLPSEIQNLFPSTFVESSLGLVPEGWGVGKVENVMELAYGKALKASDRVHGNVPVYGSGGITGFHSESLVNGPSIIVGRKGTVGTLYWEDRAFFPIDTVFYVKPKVSLCFCYYLLKSLPLADMNTDAAVPGLNRNNVYRLEVVMPPEKILIEFDQTVSLLRARIFTNDQKIQSLSTLRDTLLPRLISGQLRLPEVELN